MKKILYFLLIFIAACQPDSQDRGIGTVGWNTVRSKQNFKDSINFEKQYKIGGITMTRTAAQLNFMDATSSVQTQINSKVNIADTSAMLSPYINRVDTVSMLSHYVERKDTSGMLSHYIERKDTANMLLHYINKADTATMLDDYINKADTASMLLKYLRKLDLYQFPSYIIEQVGNSVYAYPAPRSGYAAYADTNLTTVLRNTMNQLVSGGTIHIKAGLYDHMDSLVVPHDYITIEGEGRWLTKLKLRGNCDVGRSEPTALIDLYSAEHTVIRNLELDGNISHQTKLDNNIWGDGAYMFIQGIYSWAPLYRYNAANYTLIENCYIHDFSGIGIMIAKTTGTIIRDCLATGSGSNQISLADSTYNGLIENCVVSGGGDVSLSIYDASYNCTIRNCDVSNVIGNYGSNGAQWGIEIGHNVKYCNVTGNIIHGDIKCGIGIAEGSRFTMISNNVISGFTKASVKGIALSGGLSNSIIGNTISNFTGADVIGIRLKNDTLSYVADNKISSLTTAYSYGIDIETTSFKANILHNDINVVAGCGPAINLPSGFTYGNIVGNIARGSFGISLEAGANYNVITGNVLEGSQVTRDLYDLGTGNIKGNNYGIYSAKWQPETGIFNNTATATADGLTTGLISLGSQNITVTSANANYIICLPTTSASTVGQVITGQIGANGCELRVIAAQAATVYINGVTTNVEAAIPANSTFEVRCIDATHWILKAWTALGAEITAIIPDAI